MAFDDDTNLLTKVNLNGTELVIADMDARQQIANGGQALNETNKAIQNLYTSFTDHEAESKSFITATYDAQSQTLSLTSKS